MFGKIAAVFELLPRVIAVVKMVEELLDPATPSAEKKGAALQALRNAGLPERFEGLAGGLIDVVVGIMNAFGLLNRKPAEDGTVEEPPVPEASLSTAARRERQDTNEIHATEEAFREFLEATK